MDKKYYWVYILKCQNDTYYTGYTTNLAHRYQEHINGTASKYTRSFKPLHIAQSWRIENCKTTALQMECYIKKLTKLEKMRLLSHPEQLTQIFPCEWVNPCQP